MGACCRLLRLPCSWRDVPLLFLPRILHLFTPTPRCRKDDAAVEMDEMVAAMVLTSLSCSPVVQSPPASDSGIPRECALKKNNQKKTAYIRITTSPLKNGEIRAVVPPNSRWAGLDVPQRSPWCWCRWGPCRPGDPALRDRPWGWPGSPGPGSTTRLLLFLEAVSFPRSQMEPRG